MRFTRVKTILMAGVLAASMVMPGMAVYADEGDEGNNAGGSGEQTAIKAETTAPTINKLVNVAKGITVPTTDADKIQFTVKQYDCDAGSTNTYENGDGTQQPTIFLESDGKNKKTWTFDLGTLSAIASDQADYSDVGNNQKGTAGLASFVDNDWAYGEYTFEISETSPTSKTENNEYGWTIDSTKYYLHVYVGKTDSGREVKYLVTKDKSSTTGTGTSKAYEGKVSEIKFSNTYTKKGGSGQTPEDPDNPTPKESASLWISKTVDGTSAGYEQSGTEYEFTVSFTGSNTATVPTAGYAYKVYDSSNNEVSGKSGSITSSNKTIKLENGQYAVFEDIPAGIQAKVEENVKDLVNIKDYTVKVTSNGKVVSGKEGTTTNKDTNNFLIGEGQNSAEFKNTYSDITVTGVVTDIAPYVTLVVAALIAVAAYMGLKNRIAR